MHPIQGTCDIVEKKTWGPHKTYQIKITGELGNCKELNCRVIGPHNFITFIW